ncbi:MAG TPA: tetratricopeptide repeat protein [Candidatus Acidoferrales bacterium]|nr:tetratricopeptide repeat protein [Candidatus Acidoferrales bacterium]
MSLIALCGLFLVTGFLNRKFKEHEQAIAREWYERGVAELDAGRAEAALNPLRAALVYSVNNPQYELRLGEALVAGEHYAEAKTYLLSLWERQPGSAELNLELARLAVSQGEVSEAVHYYEASLYGVWESNGELKRRAARRELIAYLLSHGQKAEAVAQTMSYAANLPPDCVLHIQAGELFLKEDSYDHAGEEFREALLLAPHNAAALAGAGRAAFEGGDYAGAERYLERANRAAPGDDTVTDRLAVARAIVVLDPNAPELSAQARGSRAQRAFRLAQARLQACGTPGTANAGEQLSALSGRAKALEPKLRKNGLARDMDLFTTTVGFVLDAEQEAAAACGPGSVEDRALTILAARRTGGQQ